MSTVTKALELLNYFRPIHLNWACLNSLVLPGVTKQPYTDICRPRTKRVHRKESSHITLQTGTGSFSTSNRRAPHASLLQGTKLVILARQMSQTYSAGAVVNEKTLLLRASGSGLAGRTFSDDKLRRQSCALFARFTDQTVTTPHDLEHRLSHTRKTGFGIANQTFETGVHGVGASVFDNSGTVAGAIAVAAPAHRINARRDHTIKSQLIIAARSITSHWSGHVPAALDEVCDEHSKTSAEIGANG